MGAVYRAEDTVLRRPVALKVLTDKLAVEPDCGARILREAQAAAALAHPNICTIYDVGELPAGLELPSSAEGAPSVLAAGSPYLAMELIEGRTLDALIRERDEFPLPELLDLAVQVAEGLAAAHLRGVVHRDLKPGNVMITSDGTVKILDFGLARRLAPRPEGAPFLDSDSGDLSQSLLGTIAYISPERALGRPGSPQSDLFSFGVMLYEMATGTRPFRGEVDTAVLAKIIECEPQPLAQLRGDLPAGLIRIIGRCLRKASEDRYHDTRDLVAALAELRDEIAGRSGAILATTPVPAPPPRVSPAPRPMPAPRHAALRRLLPWIAGALALGVALAAIIPLMLGRPAPVRLHTYRVTYTADIKSPAISPDGNFIAFVRVRPGSSDAVFTHDLRTGNELEIYRGGWIEPALWWSPDGSELAIDDYSRTTGKCLTLVVSLLGGPPKVVSKESLWALSWSPDGNRIAGAVEYDRLAIVDKATGSVTRLEAGPHSWIQGTSWSPRGHLLLIHTQSAAGVWELWIRPLNGGREFRLDGVRAGSPVPQWAASGKAIYGHADGWLWKLSVDPESGRPEGQAVRLAEIDINGKLTVSRDARKLAFPFAAAGSELVVIEAGAGGDASAARAWSPESHIDDVSSPRYSPAGLLLAFIRVTLVDGHRVVTVTTVDLASRAVNPLLTLEGMLQLAWSPDGSEIAYLVYEGDAISLQRLDVVKGNVEKVGGVDANKEIAWAAGAGLIFQRSDRRNYMLLDLDSGSQRPLLAKDEPAVWQFRASHDGRFIAFARTANRTSEMSVCIASIDDGVARVLYAGRAAPVGWSTDGRRVFLVRDDPEEAEVGRCRVEVVACSVEDGKVEPVGSVPDPSGWSQVDVSGDGRHIAYARKRALSDVWVTEDFDPEAR